MLAVLAGKLPPSVAHQEPTIKTSTRPSPILIPALAITVMVVAVLQTVVVPILSEIGSALGASAGAVGWTLTANLLAAAVLTPLLGRTGDLYGRRPVLLGILLVVTAGSLLAALTTSLPLLILARVLQGASFGLFPLAIGVLRDALPPAKLTGAMAVVSGTLGIGGGIGLVLTGLLTRNGGDYHRVFWLTFAVSLFSFALAFSTVPKRKPDTSGSIDWLGAGVLGLGLVLLLLPLSQGHTWGWTSLATLGSFVAAIVVLVLWVFIERRVREPLVSIPLMTNRPFMITNAAGLFIGIAMFVSFLAVSGFVQTPTAAGYGFGASVLAASSVYLLPGALSGVITAPLGGRMVDRFGGRATLVFACLLGVAGFGSMAALHTASWHIIVGGLLVNSAVSFGYAAMPALIVAEVAPDQTGIANGVNSIARSIGSSLASALVITLLNSSLLPIGIPRESAYVTAFVIGAAGMAISAAIVYFGLPRHQIDNRDTLEIESEHATALAAEWSTVSGR